MLRNKFWTGLKQSLNDISGHMYDTIGDFDKLRTVIRIIENGHIEPATQDQPRSGQATNKAMVTVPKSDFEGLRDEVRSLAAELKEMKKTMSTHNKLQSAHYPLDLDIIQDNKIIISAGNVHSMAILLEIVE